MLVPYTDSLNGWLLKSKLLSSSILLIGYINITPHRNSFCTVPDQKGLILQSVFVCPYANLSLFLYFVPFLSFLRNKKLSKGS